MLPEKCVEVGTVDIDFAVDLGVGNEALVAVVLSKTRLRLIAKDFDAVALPFRNTYAEVSKKLVILQDIL